MWNTELSETFTHTDKTMNDTFWIGVQPSLNDEHLEFVCEKLEEFFGFKLLIIEEKNSYNRY